MRAIVKKVAEMMPYLDHEELHVLEQAMEHVSDYEKVLKLIEAELEHARVCPHCGSENVYRHGKSAGLLRYRGNACRKTFNALTNTPLARLRKKELWLEHMELMLGSVVLREVAQRLSVDLKTAFTWRHRFTEWLKQDSPEQLNGIVEADETYFHESCKGEKKLPRAPRKRGEPAKKRGISNEQVCVFTARDRAQNTVECVAGNGPLKSDWLQANMGERVSPEALLVSDGASAYAGFAHVHELKHVVVKNREGERVKGAFHIQNINAYHSRLKGWINGHFHGVATKYLDHYLWWLHELENKQIQTASDLFRVTIGQFPHSTPT